MAKPGLKLHQPKREPQVLHYSQRHHKFLSWFHRWQYHGVTDEELQLALSVTGSNARWRRLELLKLGLIATTPYTRPTTHGGKATMYKITKAGIKQLTQEEEKNNVV